MKRMFSVRTFRKRRSLAVLIVFISVLSVQLLSSNKAQDPVPQRLDQPTVLAEQTTGKSAIDVLGSLTIKGRAPKTGYARSQFGDGWAQVGGCDMRNIMLARYMQDVLAPGTGFEPATHWLTANCSTAELSRNTFFNELSSPKTFELLFSHKSFRTIGNRFAINQLP
jgi:hypothetical protein